MDIAQWIYTIWENLLSNFEKKEELEPGFVSIVFDTYYEESLLVPNYAGEYYYLTANIEV